jgi:protein-disulfide isomerase
LKAFGNAGTGYWWPAALRALLAVSVLANIAFVSRLYYPEAIDYLNSVTELPPRVVPSDHIRGNPDAKVTVIMYTDFQCPYCTRLDASMRALMQVSDFRLIYRHFPLDFHAQGAKAAEAVECAGAQGKFWAYSDALFASGVKLEGEHRFDVLASDLGVDMKAFAACMSMRQFKQRVDDQREEGNQRRIRVTPTFYVNGKRFVGAIPEDQLKQLLVSSGT